ncbi:nucleoside phosphorylase [Tepidibacillus infernus]|uniref:Uridine phosphorylase n=1 Tax=Tepidibacillus decaturensis TaxID=1413211 RepID=A0A135L6F2_9BACI|nr:nucleoside phosphorylase [Tepidibacillus decaturensis]KXG44540.1 uridine phosphorylase [Tepidibacillus decaturensis]
MSTELQPHIQLTSEIKAKYALLPGDPKRVDKVKQHLQHVQDLAYNREYKSILGYYKDIPILVVSTGIGGPSTGIAIEELANIGVSTLIRIGSSGALQDYINLGDLIIATGSVRDEGTSKAYIESIFPAIANHHLVAALRQVAEIQNIPYHMGIIRSHDSFYTDQEDNIDEYWSRRGLLGSDMETSTLFVLGALRGIQTASVLNVVVPSKGNLQTGINNLVEGEKLSAQGEQNQIKVALEAIASIHNKSK